MLFRLTGLDGSAVVVAAASIFRIRHSVAHGEPEGTRVECGGDALFTHEDAADLVARIGPAVRFLQLTTRGGARVWLAADAISAVQAATPPDAPGTQVTVAGREQHVMERVAEVKALLRSARPSDRLLPFSYSSTPVHMPRPAWDSSVGNVIASVNSCAVRCSLQTGRPSPAFRRDQGTVVTKSETVRLTTEG